MSWARLDDALAFHEKIVEAGNAAVGVWVRMIAWSSQHLTDGVVPDKIARLVAGESRGALAALERSGLVVRRAMSPLDARGSPGTLTGFDRSQTDLRRSQSNPEGPGVYEIHDYLDYNPSRAEILAKREKERARKGGDSARNPTGPATSSTPPDPTRPDPVPNNTTSPKAHEDRSDIDAVWAHWLEKKPTTRRKTLKAAHSEYRLIKKRLTDYSVEDLCKAIDGMFEDRWSVDNDKLELGWALRQDEKNDNIERFLVEGKSKQQQLPPCDRPAPYHEIYLNDPGRNK